MEVAVAIGACATIPLAFKAIRHRMKSKVNCWFCKEDTYVKYENINNFKCPSCEQYNGFTADGDYNRNIPEQSYSTPVRYCQPVATKKVKNSGPDVLLNGLRMSPKSENGLCSDCNRNQEIIMRKVADFEPQNEDRWNEELEDYRYKLDRMYQLCARCTLAVHGKLEEDKRKYSYLLEFRSKLKRVIGTTINELIDRRKSGARSRRFYFAGGDICEVSHFLTLILSIALFFASINFLQNDSGSDLIRFPKIVEKLLVVLFHHSFSANMAMMVIHILACTQNKCRTTFPDLLIPIISAIVCLTFVFDENYAEDCALIKCACFSFITLLSTAATFIPRKKLHRKRPNRILSSAFSVASTPTSQCSSINETLLRSPSCSPPPPKKSSPPFNHKLSSPKSVSPVFRDISNNSSPSLMRWRERAQSPEVESENKENITRNMEETMEWEEAQPQIIKASPPQPRFRPSVFSQAASLRSFNQRESTPSRELAPSVASMSLAREGFRPLGVNNNSPSVFSRQNRSLNRASMNRSTFTAKSYVSPHQDYQGTGNIFERSDPSIRSGSVFTSISQQHDSTNNSIIGGSRTIALLFFLVFIVLVFQIVFFYILLKK